MEAEGLLQVLRYKVDLKPTRIIKELGLSKSTYYRWLRDVNPRYKEDYYKIIKLIKNNGLNIESEVRETKLILKEINKIGSDEWKDLMLGLQEKLDLMQSQLLNKINIRFNSHVSEWISGRRIPHDRIKFKLWEFIKRMDFNPKELIISGKKIRQSLKIDGEWILADKTLRKKDFDKDILIKRKDKIYINSPLLLPEKRNKQDIEFIEKDGKVIVFYKEKRSTRPQPLILPRLIGIDDDFLVGLGIYLGEGARNRHAKITNSEPVIINQGIRFFELFGIDKANLSAWIQLHERSNKSFEEVKKFWIENTELNNENITKIRIKKSTGNAYVKEYGTLHLEVNFILLQLLIKNLLNLIPEILGQCSLEQTKYFLQGVFAAEGSVGVRKSGTLREVSYCSTRDDERLLIKELLNRFDIYPYNDYKSMDINVWGFGNFKKLMGLDIFKYHPLRKIKLIRGFKNLENNLKKRNGKYKKLQTKIIPRNNIEYLH